MRRNFSFAGIPFEGGGSVHMATIQALAANNKDAKVLWDYLEKLEDHGRRHLYNAACHTDAVLALGVITGDDAEIVASLSRRARTVIDADWRTMTVSELNDRTELLGAISRVCGAIMRGYDGVKGVEYKCDLPDVNPIESLEMILELPMVAEATRRLVPTLKNGVGMSLN